jgi:hypothetical protein
MVGRFLVRLTHQLKKQSLFGPAKMAARHKLLVILLKLPQSILKEISRDLKH